MNRTVVAVMISIVAGCVGSCTLEGNPQAPRCGDSQCDLGEDSANCPEDCYCGNGIVDTAEVCDGTDLQGETCDGLGLGGGPLGCTSTCTLDTTSCTAGAYCGNGLAEPPLESCDTGDLAGESCESLGLGSGALGCSDLCSFDLSQCSYQLEPPYPNSQVIAGVTWDFAGSIHRAFGSDLWPVTWAADGDLYTAWGDGYGFDDQPKISLGIARLEGSPPAFSGIDVTGGGTAEHPPVDRWSCADGCGKSLGMISVDGVLYMWVWDQSAGFPSNTGLAWSEDLGATWSFSDELLDPWWFPEDGFAPIAFLNYGMDNDGARDDYVYIYGGMDGGTDRYLARVQKGSLRDRSAYMFYRGVEGSDEWTPSIEERRPYFSDPNHVDGEHVVFNAGLNRYILTAGHRDLAGGNIHMGTLGIFDAPNPWGPWTTVAYYESWFGFTGGAELGWHIPTKWVSSDGLQFWVIFSSNVRPDSWENNSDAFNLVQGTFHLISP